MEWFTKKTGCINKSEHKAGEQNKGTTRGQGQNRNNKELATCNHIVTELGNRANLGARLRNNHRYKHTVTTTMAD